MAQMLLIPDPRPLVERLGADFFRSAPSRPGVYLMRDVQGVVLYVGKAKDLRQRLAHYRVANPDRMPRRHLRLLRAVTAIELRESANEAAALEQEAVLLRELRPRFNRAGTWPGPTRYVAWRNTGDGLDLRVMSGEEEGWAAYGPMGSGAFILQQALVRLLWCALRPERGASGMPAGWFHGEQGAAVCIGCSDSGEASAWLQKLFEGELDNFITWVQARAAAQSSAFEAAVREVDFETLRRVSQKKLKGES